MHLLSNFCTPNRPIKIGTAKSNSPFITLPLAVLAVVQSSSRVVPTGKQQLQLKIILLLKIFGAKHHPRNTFNTNFFEKGTFLKRKYFSTKNFQATVDTCTTLLKQPRGLTQTSCSRQHCELGVVSFLRMRIMNNGLNQGSVISMRAVDQKQDYRWNGLNWLLAVTKNHYKERTCSLHIPDNRQACWPQQTKLIL